MISVQSLHYQLLAMWLSGILKETWAGWGLSLLRQSRLKNLALVRWFTQTTGDTESKRYLSARSERFFGLCARSLVMIRQNGWNGQITVTFWLHFKKNKQTASSSLSHFLSILSLVRHHESYCTSVGFSVKPTHFLKYCCWKCLTESVA